jgi:hypothetical protein
VTEAAAEVRAESRVEPDASVADTRMQPVRRVVLDAGHIVTDLDVLGAQIELYEGAGASTLRIATGGSCWLLLAARPPCAVETVDADVPLSVGDAFALPAGMAALLQARGAGQWLALRFSGVTPGEMLPRRCGTRRMHLSFGQDVVLARAALELCESERGRGAEATAAGIDARIRALLFAIDRFQRVYTARGARHCRGVTEAQRDRCLDLLLRMRLAAGYGDGADSVLDGLHPGSRPDRHELLALYATCFRSDPRRRPPASLPERRRTRFDLPDQRLSPCASRFQTMVPTAEGSSQ